MALWRAADGLNPVWEETAWPGGTAPWETT